MRAALVAALVLPALLAGCADRDCTSLSFSLTPNGLTGAHPVNVTLADERNHTSLAWVGSEVANGAANASIQGRTLVDDLDAFAKERGVDLSGAPRPVFIVRGVPVFLQPLSRCLV